MKKKKQIIKTLKHNALFTLYIVIIGAGFSLAHDNSLQTWAAWIGILIAGGGFWLIEHLVRKYTRWVMAREIADGVKKLAGLNNQVVVFYSKLEEDWKIAYENGESELLVDAMDKAKENS